MNEIEQHILKSHQRALNTKWDDFAREIKDLQNSNTFSILYATDIHYIRQYAKYVPAYYKLREMVEFSKVVGFDLLALTGDIADGNAPLKDQKRDLSDVIQLACEAKTTSALISKGNHDDASWFAYQHGLGAESVMTQEEWYAYAVNPIRVQYPILLDENNRAGGYYYIDYPLHRIRVINLNTNDTPIVTDKAGKILREYCGQWNMGIRENQLKWLVGALSLPEEDWSVLFMAHSFLFDTEDINSFRNNEQAWEIIQAFRRGKKGTVMSDETYFEANVSYDFTGNRSHDILAYMYGHIHADRYFVKDDIPVIGTCNILGPLGQLEEEKPPCGGWDCVLIDKKSRTFTTKRYGVNGRDRQFSV